MNSNPLQAACLTLLLGLTGCQPSDRLPTFPVSGSVSYEDGRPIEEGNITFLAAGLPPARGQIDGGSYRMTTYETHDGVVEGSFRIAISVSPPPDFDPDGNQRSPRLAQAKYGDPETSGLTFEVNASSSDTFDIVLERGR